MGGAHRRLNRQAVLLLRVDKGDQLGRSRPHNLGRALARREEVLAQPRHKKDILDRSYPAVIGGGGRVRKGDVRFCARYHRKAGPKNAREGHSRSTYFSYTTDDAASATRFACRCEGGHARTPQPDSLWTYFPYTTDPTAASAIPHTFTVNVFAPSAPGAAAFAQSAGSHTHMTGRRSELQTE